MPGWTRLGSHNKIGNYALVGIRCQDMKYKVRVQSQAVAPVARAPSWTQGPSGKVAGAWLWETGSAAELLGHGHE